MQTTQGIVLHTLKYGESSVIVHIYTNHFGKLPFLIKGVRKKRSKIPLNHFQPLTLLSFEMQPSIKREIQYLKDVRISEPLITIPFDITKNTIGQFISEVLYRVIREQEENAPLFQFLYTSVQIFDAIRKNTSVFHLMFLCHLTRYVGIMPANNYETGLPYFNISKGRFFNEGDGFEFLTGQQSALLYKFLQASYSDLESFNLSRNQKTEMLDFLLQYYKVHLENFRDINSLAVLKEIFENP